MTEFTPLHSTRSPSVDDIRVNAFPMPVYTAAGEVANTCIRVYAARSASTRSPCTRGDSL